MHVSDHRKTNLGVHYEEINTKFTVRKLDYHWTQKPKPTQVSIRFKMLEPLGMANLRGQMIKTSGFLRSCLFMGPAHIMFLKTAWMKMIRKFELQWDLAQDAYVAVVHNLTTCTGMLATFIHGVMYSCTLIMFYTQPTDKQKHLQSWVHRDDFVVAKLTIMPEWREREYRAQTLLQTCKTRFSFSFVPKFLIKHTTCCQQKKTAQVEDRMSGWRFLQTVPWSTQTSTSVTGESAWRRQY